jgi:hypothetical protein
MDVSKRLYSPEKGNRPNDRRDGVPGVACAGNFIRPGESSYVCISAAPDELISPRRVAFEAAGQRPPIGPGLGQTGHQRNRWRALQIRASAAAGC